MRVFDFAETKLCGQRFDNISVGIFQMQNERIQVWMFGTPEFWIVDTGSNLNDAFLAGVYRYSWLISVALA